MILFASFANLPGSPKDSMYSRITSTLSLVSQYCTMSLPETSALLPAETNSERPIPSLSARSMTATPSAPDWDQNPIRPGIAWYGANCPLRFTLGSVLMIPIQFGPIMRMPDSLQTRTSSCCSAAPSAPVSAKPDEITTRAWTPFWAHSFATVTTALAGTTMKARSTGPGHFSMES